MTTTEVIVGIVIGLVVSAVVLLLIHRFFPKREDTGDRLIGPIPRSVWEPAAALATERGETLPDVVERALREYGREEQ